MTCLAILQRDLIMKKWTALSLLCLLMMGLPTLSWGFPGEPPGKAAETVKSLEQSDGADEGAGVFDESAVWAEQFRLPKAFILWSGQVDFRGCFAMSDNRQWYHCTDQKQVLTGEYVSQQVNATYPFRVPLKGKLYVVREAHIDKEQVFYKHVKSFIYQYDRQQGKWNEFFVKKYRAHFKGEKLANELSESRKIQRGEIPVNYKSRNGTIELLDKLKVVEPGQYKIVLRAADRGWTVYLPSQVKCAVYLVPEDTDVVVEGTPVMSLPAASDADLGPGKDAQDDPNPVAKEPLPQDINLTGKWQVTCAASGRPFTYVMTLKQTDGVVKGKMIRTNGKERTSRINGKAPKNMEIHLVRDLGSWQQNFLGEITEWSNGRPLSLEGKFGTPGKEVHGWTAVKGN